MSSHITNANENIQEITSFYRQIVERESIRERWNLLVSEIRKVDGLSNDKEFELVRLSPKINIRLKELNPQRKQMIALCQ